MSIDEPDSLRWALEATVHIRKVTAQQEPVIPDGPARITAELLREIRKAKSFA